MSHHGLQVLYSLMNADGWACERVFTPLPDFEAALREHGLPLYSLETFTPLNQFDVARLLAPVRDLLHQRPDDARPGRDRAARRGPRAGRHAGHRRRARAHRTPSCSPRSSTCSSSATASQACRSSATCGTIDEGLGPVARGQAGPDRRQRRLGLRAPVLRADLPRRRHDPRDPPDPRRRARGDQARA